MLSEKEKMLSGQWHYPETSELTDMRIACRRLIKELNTIDPYDNEKRDLLYEKLFKQKVCSVHIESPFTCDYGEHITLGKNVYMNFNCTILDSAYVSIGNNTMFGPNVSLYTPEHPLNPEERNTLKEIAKSIKIGDNCWLGGNVVVLPGVEIGDNCVIGAGSVVTRSIPEYSVAVGNPARVIKKVL